MKYKVIKDFTDLQDNDYIYRAGDLFPREGVEVSEERIKELSTKNNKRNEVLIEAVETKPKGNKAEKQGDNKEDKAKDTKKDDKKDKEKKKEADK